MDFNELLENLREFAVQNHVPIIRDKSCEFLLEQIRIKNPKNILEIGTAIGYSGCLMLKNCNGHLTTIEINENSFNKAKQTFSQADMTERVNLINDDAINVLKTLSENQKFDFIFLDGPKGQYVRYLPYLKQMLEKEGIIFADNVYLHGLVLKEGKIHHKHRAMVNNMRAFLKQIQSDQELETNIYDVEDGIAIIKKI